MRRQSLAYRPHVSGSDMIASTSVCVGETRRTGAQFWNNFVKHVCGNRLRQASLQEKSEIGGRMSPAGNDYRRYAEQRLVIAEAVVIAIYALDCPNTPCGYNDRSLVQADVTINLRNI